MLQDLLKRLATAPRAAIGDLLHRPDVLTALAREKYELVKSPTEYGRAYVTMMDGAKHLDNGHRWALHRALYIPDRALQPYYLSTLVSWVLSDQTAPLDFSRDTVTTAFDHRADLFQSLSRDCRAKLMEFFRIHNYHLSAQEYADYYRDSSDAQLTELIESCPQDNLSELIVGLGAAITKRPYYLHLRDKGLKIQDQDRYWALYLTHSPQPVVYTNNMMRALRFKKGLHTWTALGLKAKSYAHCRAISKTIENAGWALSPELVKHLEALEASRPPGSMIQFLYESGMYTRVAEIHHKLARNNRATAESLNLYLLSLVERNRILTAGDQLLNAARSMSQVQLWDKTVAACLITYIQRGRLVVPGAKPIPPEDVTVVIAMLQDLGKSGIVFPESHLPQLFQTFSLVQSLTFADIKSLTLAIFQIYKTSGLTFVLDPESVFHIIWWGFLKSPKMPWVSASLLRQLQDMGFMIPSASAVKAYSMILASVYGSKPVEGEIKRVREQRDRLLDLDDVMTHLNKEWRV